MAWSLYSFDAVLLPDNDPQPDFSQGPVESTLLDSVGGTFDYFATRQRLPRRQTITIQGKYIGQSSYLITHAGDYLVDHNGNRLIAGSSRGDLRAQVEALTAKLGVRGLLYRKEFERPTVIQWKQARLLQVAHQRSPSSVMIMAEIGCTFETKMAGWRDENATTSTLSSSSGLQSLQVSNSGNKQIDDAQIAITAAATTTSIRVQRTIAGVDWTWTGTLTSGQTLTVDAGAQTVRIGSTNAYSGFALGSAHTARGWLPISPGTNNLAITTDATCTVVVTHYNQYL